MLPFPKQNGFVMLIVVLFMQIFILLNWYTIESVFLLEKFTHNIELKNTIDLQGKNILNTIEYRVIQNIPNCVIPISEASKLVSSNFNWQSKSCTGNFQTMQYHYVVEILKKDPCVILKAVPNAIGEYIRITLYFKKNNAMQLFFQSTIIKPNFDISPATCKGLQQFVQAGRQTWQELDN